MAGISEADLVFRMLEKLASEVDKDVTIHTELDGLPCRPDITTFDHRNTSNRRTTHVVPILLPCVIQGHETRKSPDGNHVKRISVKSSETR